MTFIFKKRVFLALILGFFFNFNAAAAMVSFFVVETGLPEDRGRHRQSVLWENAFLDIFFEAGYIVSNAPILTLERKPTDILNVIDINDAISGGIDIMVIARLDYIPDSPSPGEITLFIFSTRPRQKILERQVTGRARDSEEIKTFVRALIPYVG